MIILLQAPSILEIVLMVACAIGLIIYAIVLFTKKKKNKNKPKDEDE